MFGELTCFTNNGCSLVDYTIVSPRIFELIQLFEICTEDDYTHLPQTFVLKSNNVCNRADTSYMPKINAKVKYNWTDHAIEKLNSDDFNEIIDKFHEQINKNNINDAERMLTQSIQFLCKKSASRQINSDSKEKDSPWWDDELEHLRRVKFKWLKLLRLENSQSALLQYRNTRNKYKRLVHSKKMKHRLRVRSKIESCTSSTEF